MSESQDKLMPFLGHLEELRSRLFRAALGIFLGAILCYYWIADLFSLLTEPLRSSGLEVDIIGTSPAEAFTTKLKLAALAGVIFSLPYSFYQLWQFIAPGLHEHEKKLAAPFVFFTTLFFLAGASFCYFAAFPVAFSFFLSEYQSISVSPRIRMEDYLSFIVTTLLVFGVVFELPVLSYFLARIRVLSSSWLIKEYRYAIVTIFVIAAIITPPDVVSQLLLAGPLMVLYAMCIGVCYAVEKSRREEYSGENI